MGLHNEDLAKIFCASLLVFLAISQSVESQQYNQFEDFENQTCTRLGRKCIEGAECINRTCVCPDGTKGDGLLACVPIENNICLLRGDPHAIAHGGACGNVMLPCRYRVATFTNPLSSSSFGTGCCVDVFSYNLCSQSGKFFSDGLEVSFGVGDFASVQYNRKDLINFVISRGGVRASNGQIAQWGQDLYFQDRGVNLEITFDVDRRYAILRVRQCQMEIRFRPYDEDDEPYAQTLLPGIAVITAKTANFRNSGPLDGRYPKAVCGDPSDSDTLYKDRALALGLKYGDEAVLFDVLNNAGQIGQQLLIQEETDLRMTNYDMCDIAAQRFQACPGIEEKAKAVNTCFKLMSTRRMVCCLQKEALEIFNACLQAICSPQMADSGCRYFNFFTIKFFKKDPKKCFLPRRLIKSNVCGIQAQVEKARKEIREANFEERMAQRQKMAEKRAKKRQKEKLKRQKEKEKAKKAKQKAKKAEQKAQRQALKVLKANNN